MNQLSIPMAIVDFIPVLLFFAAAVILQRDLYDKMYKGAYALFAAGSIMVLAGGAYKALWKIIYAAGIGDWTAMNAAFFPMSSLGFMLVFLSLAGSLPGMRRKAVTMPVIVPLISTSLPFIIGQVIGLGGTQICLIGYAGKQKERMAVIYFLISFAAMLAMGYLGVKFDDSSSMHWIAQCVNILSNLAFLLGVLRLHRHNPDRSNITPSFE